MGPCNSKLSSQKIQFKHEQQPKHSIINIPEQQHHQKQKKNVGFNVQTCEFMVYWQEDPEIILDQLLSESMFFSLVTKHTIKQVISVPENYDPQIIQKISQNVCNKLQEIDLFETLKQAQELRQQFNEQLIDLIDQLSEEKLSNLSDITLPVDCLSMAVETYHILSHYSNNREQPWFSENEIVPIMREQNNQLSQRLEKELLQTFNKTIFTKKKMIYLTIQDQQGSLKQQSEDTEKKDISDNNLHVEVKKCLENIIDQVVYLMIQEVDQSDFDILFQFYKDRSVVQNINSFNQNNITREHITRQDHIK